MVEDRTFPRRALVLGCLLGAACASTRPSPAMVALEARVAYLEQLLGQREDALKFLDQAYEMRLEQETRPVPGKIYGVDIRHNVALGQVDGAPDALVTIVEAWDFA